MTSETKPDLEIWDIDKLVPYGKNAKVHPPEQVKRLASLIREKGWTALITIEGDGTIIAGHGRRLAAIEMGLKRVPVIVRRDLTKAQARELRLADNKVASTQYDHDMLQEEMRELLAEVNSDFTAFGFSEKELEFLVEPLEMMDETLFVDNIQEAVEGQKAENEIKAEELDGAAAPIGDAFGFRRFTVAQSRRVRGFMTRIEAESGKKGADALMVFLDNLGA